MQKIPTISLYDQMEGKLESYAPGASFAIFSPENNYHNITEMTEIYHFLYGEDKTKPIIDLVAFRPQRILAHEIIIALTVTVIMHNLREDLQNKFTIIEGLIDIQEFIRNGNNLRDLYIQSPDNISAVIEADKFLSQQLRINAKHLVSHAIDSQIELGLFEALSDIQANNRITFTINGAIASGKGSFEPILKQQIKEIYNKSWYDLAKINGDSYKLVLNPNYIHETSHKKIILFSQLVQEEIHLIARSITARLLEKLVTTGKAPDVYIDKSLINDQGIELATIGGGQVHGILASLNVEEALERSNSRGQTTGRFEDTRGVLESHKNIASNFINLMIKHKGKDVSYTIYDNNIPLAQLPIKTASANFKSQELRIYNERSFTNFLDKVNFDVEQSLVHESIIYNNQTDTHNACFLGNIIDIGYSIYSDL